MMSKSSWLLPAWTGVVLAFSLGPLATIILFSFNRSPYYSFPITGFTLQWYQDLFADSRILLALGISVLIASVTAILATTIGTSFAFGIVRSNIRARPLVATFGFLPLVTPVLVLAASLQVGFLAVGLPLGYGTVLLGHTIYTTPFVVLMVMAQLYRYDTRLDAAARDLGGTMYQMLRYVTLPILWPAIRSAALLAFLLSFNEWAISFFTGRGFNTLPMLVYSMQRNGLPPTVLAYSSLVISLALAAVLLLLPYLHRVLASRQP